ncbi:MAG: putative hydrolase of the superfamily [Actinomycetota bacterium]|jgi:putative hydrolase of the HAD superfamily|nr:putative hydrolase of the superfamily [Actinomycetota bacterium]
MPLEAVIFDWGGTLSVFASLEMIDVWTLAAEHLAPERVNEVRDHLVAVEQSIWDRVAEDQRPATLAEILALASQQLGLDVAEAVLEEAAVRHLDSWTPHIVHDDDAAPTLRAIREQGFKTGLLSNTHWPRSFHEHFLDRDGLTDLLDVRCYTSEMERTKPHASAFRHVLDALEVDDPAAAVFVGDRPYDDVFGALRSGLRGVLRTNPMVPSYDVEPSAVIDRLPELLPLLATWRAEAGTTR